MERLAFLLVFAFAAVARVQAQITSSSTPLSSSTMTSFINSLSSSTVTTLSITLPLSTVISSSSSPLTSTVTSFSVSPSSSSTVIASSISLFPSTVTPSSISSLSSTVTSSSISPLTSTVTSSSITPLTPTITSSSISTLSSTVTSSSITPLTSTITSSNITPLTSSSSISTLSSTVTSSSISLSSSIEISPTSGPPDIIDPPADTIQIDDNDVTLICNALSLPQHNITWMYQRMRSDVGKDIISTSSSDTNMKYLINNTVNTTSFGTLTITNLQYDDRGIYTCVAANEHGAVSADAMVNVHVKPTNLTISGGDRFNISSQVNLTCTAIGVPLPTIMWQLNGNNVPTDPDCVLDSYNVNSMVGLGLDNCTVIQTVDLANGNTVTDPQDILELGMSNLTELVVVSNLLIRSLQRIDNGSYTCNVTNTLPQADTISVVSCPTPVTVLERPDLIQNVDIVDQHSRWVYIQWNIPYDGNSDIMGYNLYIRFVNTNSDFTLVMTSSSMGKRQANMFTTTTNSYNVTEQILPFMRYQFAVVACNKLGCRDLDLAVQSLIVQTQEEAPETPPLNCSATAVSSTSIDITWLPPVMPNGIITDYNVSYVPGQSLSTADYSTDGNVSINTGNNDTNTIVTNLRIATSYTIVLVAHTVVGIGPYSNPMECVVQTLEDVPDGPPLSVTLSSPTSTSIAVRWQLPDPLVRNGIITKHQLNYTEVSQPLNWTTVSLDGDTSYVIEDLEIFTRYYVSVSAGTQIDGYGLFSDPVMIRTVPDGLLDATVQSVGETTIMLTLTKPTLVDEAVLYYEVYYTSAGQGSTLSTNSTTTRITLSNLVPGVEYTINVTAVTTTGGRISSTTFTATTLTTALFQLRLSPIGECLIWTVDRQNPKLDDIRSAVMEYICSCTFNIVDESFSCRGSKDGFENTVVFRARVTIQGPNADDVVNNITNWVQSSPSISVDALTLAIDPNCPAMLDSFNSADCVIVTEEPTPSPNNSSPSISSSSDSTSSTTGIIVGVVMGVVCILILVIVTVVVIVMYRRRKASVSAKKQPEDKHDRKAPKPGRYEEVNPTPVNKPNNKTSDYHPPKYENKSLLPGSTNSINPPSPVNNPDTMDKTPAQESTVLANKTSDNHPPKYENISLQPTSSYTEYAVMTKKNPAFAETQFNKVPHYVNV